MNSQHLEIWNLSYNDEYVVDDGLSMSTAVSKTSVWNRMYALILRLL